MMRAAFLGFIPLAAAVAACGGAAGGEMNETNGADKTHVGNAAVTGEEGRATLEEATYRRTCDGSAGAALSGEAFVNANDEDNRLLLYSAAGGDPSSEFDLAAALGAEEADLEGAARINDLIYWIGSHGRSEEEAKPARRVLLATRVNGDSLTLAGQPYRDLLADLDKAPATAKLKLGAAAEKPAESEGGLNIEGLAATASGHLLIGFRNPLPGGRALVVEISNPLDIIAGKPAQIEAVYRLALGNGMGVRSLEWSVHENGYLIVAGPSGDEGSFAFYRWAGDNQPPSPIDLDVPSGFRPEGFVQFESGRRLLLSDDGDALVDEKKCKKASVPFEKKRFRGLLIGE